MSESQQQQQHHTTYLDPTLFSGGIITASLLIFTLIWQNIQNKAKDIARESTDKAIQSYSLALTDKLKELGISISTLNSSINCLQESFNELDRKVEKNENQHPFEHQILNQEISGIKNSINEIKENQQHILDNFSNLIQYLNKLNPENQFIARKRTKSP